MVKIKSYVADCPKCGEELYLFITDSKKRYIKCLGCGFSYPIPRKGKVEFTAMDCPLDNTPIIAIMKYIRVPGSSGTWMHGGIKMDEYILDKEHSYFYTTRPCYSCPKFDVCEPLQELRDEYFY